MQKYGIDYEETFSPVVCQASVRTLLPISASENFQIYQFDVQTAFLHDQLEEEIFMEQPYGFEEDDRVCLLKRSLYGLKQAPRQWNKRIVTFLQDFGFAQSRSDPCIFFRVLSESDERMYLALYVVDGLLCRNNNNKMMHLLCELHRVFKITYSNAECFVGIQICRNKDEGRLNIHQTAYAERILQRFSHESCNPVLVPADPSIKFTGASDCVKYKSNYPYRQAIGSLMYLMTCTRPDLAYIVGVLSRYMEQPQYEHWCDVKRVLKYLKGTINYGVSYGCNTGTTEMVMYSDADYGGDIDTGRSTTGWICLLNGGAIAWSSRRQPVATTSTTTEAEFLALCAATKEIVWLRRMMSDLYYK